MSIRVFSKLENKSISDYWNYFKYNFLKTYSYKIRYLKCTLNYAELSERIKGIDISIKELTYNDFLLGDKNQFSDKKLAVIKHRFEDPTYKGYGIIENGVLIYSTWISLQKMGLPVKSNYNLALNEGLLEDSYCHPMGRGQGLHKKMNLFRLCKLYEFGKTKCLALVLEGNTPAYKVQINSGFNDLGYFYVGKILGFPFVTLNKKKYDCK